jgi:hypothetical protein
LGKLRQNEPWVGGEAFPYFNTINQDDPTTTREYECFGVDVAIADVNTSKGTFSARVVTEPKNAVLQQMLLGFAPSPSIVGLEVDPNKGCGGLPVWTNYRSPDDTHYWMARYDGVWTPSPVGRQTGNIEDPSLPEYTGPTTRPSKEYKFAQTGGMIYGELLTTVTSGSTGYTASGSRAFVQPPNADAGAYAIDVIGITGSSPIATHAFSRGGDLMNASGVVTVTPRDFDEVAEMWSSVSALYVIKMITGSGTWKGGNPPVACSTLWNQ